MRLANPVHALREHSLAKWANDCCDWVQPNPNSCLLESMCFEDDMSLLLLLLLLLFNFFLIFLFYVNIVRHYSKHKKSLLKKVENENVSRALDLSKLDLGLLSSKGNMVMDQNLSKMSETATRSFECPNQVDLFIF